MEEKILKDLIKFSVNLESQIVTYNIEKNSILELLDILGYLAEDLYEYINNKFKIELEPVLGEIIKTSFNGLLKEIKNFLRHLLKWLKKHSIIQYNEKILKGIDIINKELK